MQDRLETRTRTIAAVHLFTNHVKDAVDSIVLVPYLPGLKQIYVKHCFIVSSLVVVILHILSYSMLLPKNASRIQKSPYEVVIRFAGVPLGKARP